jgi:uncharacterized membrane protein
MGPLLPRGENAIVGIQARDFTTIVNLVGKLFRARFAVALLEFRDLA